MSMNFEMANQKIKKSVIIVMKQPKLGINFVLFQV